MWRPRRLGAAGAALCLATLAAPPRADAEPSRGVDLEWRAPPGCPDEAWARTAIDAYLGQRAHESFKPIAVRVEITAAPGGRWRAALSVGGGANGSRTFEGATCSRVGDAAVLIVALMLDPVEVVAQMEPRVEAPRGAPPVAEEPRVVERPDATRIELAVQAAGDAGSLPEPTLGAGLGAGLRSGRLSMELDLLAWVPRRAFGGPTPSSGGEIRLYTASLRGCWGSMRGLGLVLAPCARAEGGISSGTGFGIAEPASSQNFWGAAFLGFLIRQASVQRLGAWLAIEGGVPFARPNYVIEEFGTVFRAAPVLGRVSLGLAWSFP